MTDEQRKMPEEAVESASSEVGAREEQQVAFLRTLERAKVAISKVAYDEYKKQMENVPDLLYHYTDAAGLKGIIDSGKLWASHAWYLNDPHEIQHGIRLFLRSLKQHREREKEDKEIMSFLDMIRTNWDMGCTRDESPDNYYFCASLSAKHDDLSQYRAYANAGAGYCIGFSKAELKKNLDEEYFAGGSLFDIVRIQYDEKHQEMVLQSIVEQAVCELKNLLQLPYHRNVAYELSQCCIRAATVFISCCKQHGFAAEDEYRIIVTPRGAPLAMPIHRFLRVRSQNGLFIPYLELPIAHNDSKLTTLSKIYIGPRLPFEKAKRGVFYLLHENGRQDNGKCGLPDYVEILPSRTALQ